MNDHAIRSLGQLADRIAAAADGPEVSTGDLVDSIGKHSLHPLLMLPALLAATPLSGIPGLSALCGLAIAAISFQLAMSFDEVRLPGFLMRRRVESEALCDALDRTRPVLDWVDLHTRRDRLAWLFRRPVVLFLEILCLVSGLAMPFLEVIPFSASIVASGVLLLTLSMLTRDGLFFVLAMLPYAGLLYLLGGRIL
jgi:Uncharacterized ABC-type transport system, permease components